MNDEHVVRFVLVMAIAATGSFVVSVSLPPPYTGTAVPTVRRVEGGGRRRRGRVY